MATNDRNLYIVNIIIDYIATTNRLLINVICHMLRARIEHNRWIGYVTHRRVHVPYGIFALSHQQK